MIINISQKKEMVPLQNQKQTCSSRTYYMVFFIMAQIHRRLPLMTPEDRYGAVMTATITEDILGIAVTRAEGIIRCPCRELPPSAAQSGIEGDDGLQLLQFVIDAVELCGQQVLLGGEHVGVVGFGIGFHQRLCVFHGQAEEVDLSFANDDLVGGGLVVVKGV